ncbi:MAG TPA: hypothetical protein VF173_35000 [Thermoanaerobaculia bacterium]|nr:hypothetical protein [Thermoanaerobaculia bacterium]
MRPGEWEERWSLATRIAFRFFFSYFVLFFVTGWLDLVPFTGPLIKQYDALCLAVVTWLEAHVVHTGYEIYLLEGSGGISNTPFGTILFFFYVALVAVATVVWSILDRKRAHYARLQPWLRLLLRFMLGVIMIHYGVIKLIPYQMTAPLPLYVLTQRVGDLPPMRLLWIFIGASPAYESFTGLAELLGGMLLLLPRTAFLGAVLCVADMVMVVMLNLCYDVHVKLLSMHLLVMALVLVAPDARRLADLFLFNRRVEPAVERPLSCRRWLHVSLQTFVLLYGLYTVVAGLRDAYKKYQTFHPPRPPLYGVWRVEEFVVDGKAVPYAANPERWRTVTFLEPGSVTLERVLGPKKPYKLDLDLKGKRLRLGAPPAWQADFALQRPEPGVLILDGPADGHSTHVKLRKMPLLAQRLRWFFDLPKDQR